MLELGVSVLAEILALLEGRKLAKARGLSNFLVERDSVIVLFG